MERAELLAMARAGNGDAFRELTEPYRRELQVHCYRMLGSFQDAEDALQDSLLAAWQGFGGFEERASLRTWLYRIATNKCLDSRRSASRRPAKGWDVPNVEPPAPSGLGEVVWLEPYPDALLEGAIGMPLGPEARYERNESVSLAFVTALQVLVSQVGFPGPVVASVEEPGQRYAAAPRPEPGIKQEMRRRQTLVTCRKEN